MNQFLFITTIVLFFLSFISADNIIGEVDLKLIDLYKKQYGEESIVKVSHKNKKHYATKDPIVLYEILVVAESFYNREMADRMLEVRSVAANNVPYIPGTYNMFAVYVPTFAEWSRENNKERHLENVAASRDQVQLRQNEQCI